MSRVVVAGTAPYDVFVGRGRCPGGEAESPWAVPRSIALCRRVEVVRRYRVWFWSEIQAGGVDVGELAALHGKVFGVRKAAEGWHVVVLEAAAMWALAEQARRLEVRLGKLKEERRREAAAERVAGD